jgi:hypothetical protein
MAGGVAVGVVDGFALVGLAVGFAVGAAVGLTVGIVVCLTVGFAGVAVGIAVGFALSVGAAIGVVEGETVGVPVGVVAHRHARGRGVAGVGIVATGRPRARSCRTFSPRTRSIRRTRTTTNGFC